jgi:methionyl-tRNA synthetase
MDEDGRGLVQKCIDAGETIAKHYEDRKFNQAVVEICRLADAANEYFDKREPWKSIKTDEEATRTALTSALNAFRIIAIYLSPILPEYAKKAMKLFGENEWSWQSPKEAKENCALGEYEYLASRIDIKQVEAMVEAAKVRPGESGEVSHESRASKNKGNEGRGNREEGIGNREEGRENREVEPLKAEIAFPDFEKLDLRVGVVESCEIVPKSSKLLKFVLDAGTLGKRTIFSGIRQAYPQPQDLVGKEVVFVANLAPRKMSVGVSEGMILFAGEPGQTGGVVSPLDCAFGGTQVT